MLQHVSNIDVHHLQGIRTCIDMCSLCFNLYGRNFTFVIKIIIIIIIIMIHEL